MGVGRKVLRSDIHKLNDAIQFIVSLIVLLQPALDTEKGSYSLLQLAKVVGFNFSSYGFTNSGLMSRVLCHSVVVVLHQVALCVHLCLCAHGCVT